MTTASGAAARAAGNAPTVIIEPEEEIAPPGASLVAAANVPGFATGGDYSDMTAVAEGFMARARGFYGRSDEGWDRYGVAKIRKPENEFTIDDRMNLDDQLDIVHEASRETRLPGGSLAASSLTAAAAGGWCAPSETLYGFCDFEQPTDLLSIAEVQINRGGIRYTKGPDFSALSASWGFIQTEAQAEAGTAKVCYAVECPPFVESRLDAIGFCITAGILTNAAYPELVQRVLEMGLAAHRLKVDAYILGKITTALGAAVNWTEKGSATGDILAAIEYNALVQRTKYGFPSTKTMEVILPTWIKALVRQDLSFRTGVDLLNVTDAVIASYFAARNLAVQFVAAHQPLVTTGATAGQAFPTTVTALIYPAGAFVKGTTSVIDLDTVYDSTLLSTNKYTAAFFEEGISVVNTCYGGAAVAIDITSAIGETGAANLATP